MALHDIREVRIPIELDKPRTLLFDLNAFAELEDKFGSLDQAFQKMQQGSVKATRTLLWAGLLHEDEKLTERQVGAMISLTNVERIMEQITDALTAALPEDTGKVQQAMEQVVEKTLKRKADKRIILMLSSLLCWFVALLLYVVLSAIPFTESWSWLFFVYAIPANAIVLLSLRSAWRDFRRNKIYISVIVWGSLLSIYVTLRVFLGWDIWKMFLLGIPGQIAVLLWFRMFRGPQPEAVPESNQETAVQEESHE